MGKYLIETYDYVKCILLMHKRGAEDLFFFRFCNDSKIGKLEEIYISAEGKKHEQNFCPAGTLEFHLTVLR